MKKISENFCDNGVVNLTENQIIEINNNSDIIANYIKEGKEIDEGVIGALVGGLTGALVGPSIGMAICKALGITNGLLYNLLNSRVFTTAVASYLGYKQ